MVTMGGTTMCGLSVLCFLLIAFVHNCLGGRRVICYHGTWSVYRHGHGTFGVADINPHLCTHLMYAFFGVSPEGRITILDPYLDLEDNYGRGNIKQFNALKRVNPRLKTLAAVGGWNEGSKTFSLITNDPELRSNFAKDATNFALKHNFDGIDVDWEYPGRRGGNADTDKDAFVLLMQALHVELRKHNLLLTAAVSATEVSAEVSYDIPALVKYVDFLNVMTYDFHGAWDPELGFNAPLFAGAADKTALQLQLNVNASLSFWLAQGVPREKMVMGIPFYGRSFRLISAHQHQPGDLHSGPGLGGPYTGESGNYGFNEICEFVVPDEKGWVRESNSEQAVPYYHSEEQWIGYDDMESVRFKGNYVNELQLGGAMVWSIETDDFKGFCGMGAFPLLRQINGIFGNVITDGSTTSTAATTVTTSTESSDCKESEITRDPNNCSAFFMCSNGKRYRVECPNHLYFDLDISSCNWPWLVDCGTGME